MKRLSRNQLIVFLFFVLHQSLFGQSDVTFSIQAHADDWQLFMSSNLIDDASDPDNKVVFITFTAGDDGHANHGFNGSEIPYYLARERGSVYSSKFIADLRNLKPEDIPKPKKAVVSYKKEDSSLVKHCITKYIYKNTVNYFLRLPDGNRHGSGYKTTDEQSLQKLKEGDISKISAIDNSATYENWDDLVKTVRQIILSEQDDDEQIWINCASINTRYNPNDHSDHRHASLAAREAVADMDWVGIASWMNYASRKKRANLNNRQHQNAAAVFAVYNWALLENRYYGSFDHNHQWWLLRDYYKITPPTGFFTDRKTLPQDSLLLIPTPMITAYTNPVRVGEKIEFSTEVVEKGHLEVELIDMNGATAKTKKLQVKEGPNNFNLPTDNLVEGVYVVRLDLNHKYVQSKKVVLVN